MMRNFLVLILAVSSLAFSIQTLSAADLTVLIEEGRAKATIYVEGPLLDRQTVEIAMKKANFPDVVSVKIGKKRRNLKSNDIFRSAAVLDLNYHLLKMTGTELPVIVTNDPNSIKKPAVVLGELANRLGAKPTENSSSKETFRIISRDDLLLVGGESDLAVRHGMYEILRKLGYDWVMPGEIGEIIPKKPNVALSTMDVTQQPDFAFRRLWYRGYKNRRAEEALRFRWWQWRHKGGHVANRILNVRGHYWQRFIKKHKAEFDADPTMYALVAMGNGKSERRGPQIETTHPRMIQLFIEDIRSTYEKNIAAGKWTKHTKAGFPIGPADGLGYSLSAETLAAGSLTVDPMWGELDRTDNLVLLANRILKEVTQDYPNAYVGFYSYSVHSQYPTRYIPHPNLVQEFAPIGFSRFHSVLDPISKTQNSYRTTLEKWGKLAKSQGNILSGYGYNWNLADNLLPYSKVQIWGDDLPYYHKLGFIGLSVEATKQWSVLAPSDYVFMRMAWDTSQDWRKLLEEFCQNAYGSSAVPMLRYWRRLIETQRSAGMEAGSYHAFPLIFDKDWLVASQNDLAEALALANTEGNKTRINHVGIGVEFLRLYLKFHSATLQFEFVEARRIQDKLFAAWQRAYDQNTDLVANEAPRYWKRFLGEFVDQSTKYSSSPYRMILPVPDELTTALDPMIAGERLNLHRPEVRDDGFIKTRTFSTTWDAQGLGGVRSGAIWYRWKFDVPEEAKGEPIGLFVGGVEDTVRVWMNGQYIGSSGRAFSKPILFDLTSSVTGDSQNLLAMQVIRVGKANELGLGGVIRPSFLFTGPRLENPAPEVESKTRVLPGGEIDRN
ncbi:MAG: DUF4838 domain-containing protein [Rhizobiaceae bacterium]